MADEAIQATSEPLPPLRAMGASDRAPIFTAGEKPMDYVNALIQARPDYQEQYNTAAANLSKAYSARSVEGEDAAQWAALAKGFAQPASNFWQSLANAGAAKGEAVANIEASRLKNQQDLAKQEYSHISDLLKTDTAFNKGMVAPMMKQQFAPKQYHKIGENLTAVFDPMAGTTTVVAESVAEEMKRQHDKYWTELSKILHTDDPDVLEAKVRERMSTTAEIGNLNPPQGVQTPGGKLTPLPNTRPVIPGMPQPIPGNTSAVPASGFTGAPSMSPDTITIPPAQQAATDAHDRLPRLQAEFAQAKAARDKLAVDDPAREQLNQVMTALVTELKAMPTPVPPPSLAGVTLRTPESTAEEEGRGKERGKLMEKEFHDLQGQGMAAQNLIGNLNVMEGLYAKHGENIPSGAAAGTIAEIKSGLSTFGINFEGNAATDAINAIATKGALQSRTADGTNLLPGAMSNYEDRLLQKTFPTLAQTSEGRMLQIQIMKAQLGMKAELASAARSYYQQNGKLDSGWYNVAQSIATKNPFLDPARITAMETYAKRLAGVK